MVKKDYGILEQHIIDLFAEEGSFNFAGTIYQVVEAGKPRPIPGHGECKTDVYILGRDSFGNTKELKISVKSLTSVFQGNKFQPHHAEALLGEDWESIVSTATQNLRHLFESTRLIYPNGYGRTKPNSITMGWKLEIADKPRDLSAKLPLNNQEVRDIVYKGLNQSPEKQDSLVNSRIIYGSGIAEYIIKTDIMTLNSSADVINQMIPIDQLHIKPTYLIFTGNNYRTDVDKTDGPRCLAVIVEWELVNGKLKPVYIYDQPLSRTGKENKLHVRQLLDQLGITHPSEVDMTKIVCNPSLVHVKR